MLICQHATSNFCRAKWIPEESITKHSINFESIGFCTIKLLRLFRNNEVSSLIHKGMCISLESKWNESRFQSWKWRPCNPNQLLSFGKYDFHEAYLHDGIVIKVSWIKESNNEDTTRNNSRIKVGFYMKKP